MKVKKEDGTEQVLMMDIFDEPVINANQIRSLTVKDPVLSQAHGYILRGWPEKN